LLTKICVTTGSLKEEKANKKKEKNISKLLKEKPIFHIWLCEKHLLSPVAH
jgi:hypothetical protein